MGVGLTQHFFKCEAYTLFIPCTKMGRDSALSKTTRYELESPGIEFWWCRDFPHPFIPALGHTQPPVQRVSSLSQGVKRPGRKRNNCPAPKYRVTIKEIDTFNVVLKRNY